MSQLCVLFGDESDLSPLDSEKGAAVAQKPGLAWRLREFYLAWYADKRHARVCQETRDSHLRAIRYWEAITDDWRLVDFLFDEDGGDGQALKFTSELPEWAYCRRGVPRGQQIRIGRAADNPSFTQLSSSRASCLASRIAEIFRAMTGPPVDQNRKRYARLLSTSPVVDVIPRMFEEKQPFDWPSARSIAAGCGLMKRPAMPLWLPRELYWRLHLALLFYTGLRMGTLWQLRWRHVQDFGDKPALRIPAEMIKTGKKIELPIHPQLAGLLLKLRSLGAWTPDDLILPLCCGRRTFLDLHLELQRLAQIPESARQSLHAWRRTHLAQIFELGAGRGLEAAQVAADHSDGRTTAQHYVATVVNHFRLRLPPLFVHPAT